MYCCPKSSMFCCVGQKAARPEVSPCRWAPALVDTYSDLHQAMGPLFGGAFRIKAQLRQLYHMDICEFYFTSN